MSALPVLDTSFLIDLQRGHKAAADLLRGLHRRRERMLVPAQAAAQYVAGSDNPLVAWSRLRDAFEVLPLGRDEILETARLARLAKQRGLRPHWGDLSIAAAATLHGTNVVTANVRAFQRVDVPVVDHRGGGPDAAAA